MRIKYSESTMIILTSLFLSCNAFWWRTTTEATPLLRQMPISYFRTYTYHQPIGYPNSLFQSPNYNTMPNRFSGWSQFPEASDGVPVLSNYKQETTTVGSTTPTQTTTTTPIPTQPSTLPPTQSSLFHAKQQSSINVPLQQLAQNQISLSSSYMSSAGHHYFETNPQAAQHLTSTPIRSSAYLTPDYPSQYYYTNNMANSPQIVTSAKYVNRAAPSVQQNQRQQQQIRFVPCMCPVSVSISNEFPESRSASNDNDDDMILSETEDVLKTKDIDDMKNSS